MKKRLAMMFLLDDQTILAMEQEENARRAALWAQAEARIRAEKPIDDFLGGLMDLVRKDAPKWTSTAVPYDFGNSLSYFRKNFPVGCDKDLFREKARDLALSPLRESSYPNHAYGAWFLGVLASGLADQGQQDIVLDEIVPELWASMDPYKVGDFINPGILDVLNGKCRDEFLEKIVTYLDKEEPDLDLVERHIYIGAHLGSYNLEDEKDEIAGAFTARIGVDQVASRLVAAGSIGPALSVWNKFFIRLPEEQGRQLAEEIDRQIGAEEVAHQLKRVFTGEEIKQQVYPYTGMLFLTSLLQRLSPDKKEEYAQAMLAQGGEETMILVESLIHEEHENKDIRHFIGAFPPAAAKNLIDRLTQKTLNADYAAEDGNYGDGGNDYTSRMHLAAGLHKIVPPQYTAYFEKQIIDFLEDKSAANPRDAFLKASLLVRGPLADEGNLRTREVDFYRMGKKTSDAVAHIRPDDAQGIPGVIAAHSFIGSLSDYHRAATREERFSPRFEPPNARELFPQELYRRLFSGILAADQQAVTEGPEQDLPRLVDVLRARQALKIGLN